MIFEVKSSEPQAFTVDPFDLEIGCKIKALNFRRGKSKECGLGGSLDS